MKYQYIDGQDEKLITINNQIFVTFDHNKRIFLTVVCPNGDGLLKTDDINRMITVTMITLSGFHCMKIMLDLSALALAGLVRSVNLPKLDKL